MESILVRGSEKMLDIHFEKLFGRFDYDVILNSEGLTILTGPNGYGKSTILRSIEAIGKGSVGMLFFFELDFEKIIANFEENRRIIIEKINGKLVINGISVERDSFIRRSLRNTMKHDWYLSGKDTWIDAIRGAKLSLNDYFDVDFYKKELGMVGQDENKYLLPTNKLSDIFKEMKQLIGDIYFIREQRLIEEKRNRHDKQEVINVIEELPDRFIELMRSVQQDYSAAANELDSTYPYRLFSTEEGITQAECKAKMEEMTSKFRLLSKYDLSTMQEPVSFMFKDEYSKALKIYFDDFDVKYRVYEDFINKLDLYTDIINHRLTFKSIKISKEFGISIIDEKNKRLKLTQLSSGEKQEIVLFYDLIFRTQKNVLLLIDEPEISLHITWQKKFMDDLLRIIKCKDFNVIVATHSPQIINNHWERQIDLGELYGQQLNKR